MPRHAKPTNPQWRFARATALVAVWTGGLAAGFFAILSTAARYSCSHAATGLACRPAGTALGGGLVIAVIATVTVVTLATHESGRRRLAVWTAAGAITLLACYLTSRALINTA